MAGVCVVTSPKLDVPDAVEFQPQALDVDRIEFPASLTQLAVSKRDLPLVIQIQVICFYS